MMSNEVCTPVTVGAAIPTFTSALQFFAAATCLIQTTDWPPDAEIQDGDEFDFIIVGGGTAGSVIASRLSEVDHWKVLLLEAGGDPPIESDIPFFDETMHGTKYDWQYKTVNNGKTNQAFKNKRVNWTRGKMLGGSGSINKMAYVQGHPHDYENWFDEGNLEWHPNITKRYYKKAESLQDHKLLENPTINEHYGYDGPISINSYNYSNHAFIDNMGTAWEEIGIKHVSDLNTANNMGFGKIKVTVSEGRRVSTATAYLNPIAHLRKNLKVGKNSFVTKVLIDDELKVQGVEVNRNNSTIRLYARQEVILSAGSINTPQLLMLSGIGPVEHLTAVDIKPLINSPMVGQNLHDHTFIPVIVFAEKTEQQDQYHEQLEVLRYLSDRQGFLSFKSFSSICAFYADDEKQSFPDHQILNTAGEDTRDIKSLASQYINSVENSLLEQSVNKSLFQFLYVLLHPHSRGNISLSSNNPYDYPRIYYDNYSDSRDLDRTTIGIKKLTRIINTEYFKSIGASLGRIELEACESYKLDSNEYWKCIAPNVASTVWHPVGTAKMGTDIKTSVIDSRLRVHGVCGLRVVDASVMPTITSGNTNAPTIMIAERAADLVKEDFSII